MARTTSRHPGTFQRVCDALYLLIMLGCAAAFVLSWRGRQVTMKGFPVLFFLAAGMNFLTSFLKFRRDSHRKNRKLEGIFYLLAALALLALTWVSAVCIWGADL